MKTIKYPSIEQFKNVISLVSQRINYLGKDENGKAIYGNFVLPTLKFTGTVKIHGSNGGIRFSKEEGKIVPQSRERDLSILSDNMGFYVFVYEREQLFQDIINDLIGDNDTVVIYGEWAGKGVQSKVAISQLEKFFTIFGIKFIKDGEEYWEDISIFDKYIPQLNEVRTYLINQFKTFEVEIDFNSPKEIQNELVRLVEEVENECPVGKYFGVVGTGEGIVFSCDHEKLGHLKFKCKGEKHSNSKVKTIAPIDEESYRLAKDFAENYVTEARLEQGIFVMKNEMLLEPIDKNVGIFIKWVIGDVIKEEQNSIIENKLDPKKISKEISNIARKWYFEKIL